MSKSLSLKFYSRVRHEGRGSEWIQHGGGKLSTKSEGESFIEGKVLIGEWRRSRRVKCFDCL
jgi:hypothetical protein